MRLINTCAFVSFVTSFTISAYADWPEFRGPTGDGHVAASSTAADLPLKWSETENVRWKTPIPHLGWSTPVVLGGQVWLTTATEDGHDFFAICVDAATGKILHNVPLFHCNEPEPLGNNVNCYASPSPAIEPGRVYVHFGSYGTACLDTITGEVLWKRDNLPCRHYRGPSSSVVLFENLAILTFDGADLQYLAALDKQSGNTVWTTDRSVEWNDENITGEYAKYADMAKDGDFRKAHSTPLIVESLDGRLQMLSGGAKAAYGYDPHTGRELWRVEFDDWSVAPRPLYQDGTAYMVTGLMHPELLAIRIDGEGVVTDTHVDWRIKTSIPKTASAILADDLIYMVTDDGVVSCVDAATGEEVWKKRIRGRYAASPIYAAENQRSDAASGTDSRLYFCNQDGETTVLKAGRDYKVLATNTLDDGFMASPAAADGSLFLRTRSHLYRIESAGRQ